MPSLRIPYLAFLPLALCVLVNNSAPTRDVAGNILDCADGSIQLIGGVWWQHCVSYGLCEAPLPYGCTRSSTLCGFTDNHNISIFSSPDLSSGSWTFHGYALEYTERPVGILYRPDVVYNAATRLYVLWANIVNLPVFHGYFAATSPSVTGPFTVVSSNVNVTRASGGGDFHFFIDDDADATGYVIYSTDHYMGVEQLTPDYTASTGKTSAIFPIYFVESPSLIKRQGIYYALFGHCCCFCLQGSGVIVYTAPHPLGPWTLANSTERPSGDEACMPPAPPSPASGLGGLSRQLSLVDGAGGLEPEDTPDEGCAYINGTVPTPMNNVSITKSQQNYIIRLRGGELIWTGNRWGQAPDGIKGHEPQAWLPLVFNPDGSIQEMAWVDTFEITP